METIVFRIIKVNEYMCRIETVDCRTIYKDMEDGSCIGGIEVMLSVMEEITRKVENLGNKAVFVYEKKSQLMW